MFFEKGALKSFPVFTGKHLCWSLFFKSLQAEGMQLYLKKSPAQVFFCEVCEMFKNTFFYRTPPVFGLPVAASVFFFKKVIKQLFVFRNLVMTY